MLVATAGNPRSFGRTTNLTASVSVTEPGPDAYPDGTPILSSSAPDTTLS